jgi:TP901 family phage tail tape measure protein
MLLAQLVVEYVADVSGLQKGVTAVTETISAMNAVVEESTVSFASFSAQTTTVGAELDGLSSSIGALDASLASVDASADAAIAGIGGVEAELTGVAATADATATSVGAVETELATTATSADTAALSLGAFTISEDSMAAATDVVLGGLATLGTALAAVGIAAGVAGGVSAKMAGDFQQSMTQLVTGAGEAQSNIQMVSDGILNMAPAVGTSTKDLAAGMYMIESAGQHGSQALTTLKDAAEGAKVGAASLADVANGVTTEMTDYASSGLTAAQATNTLIATVANGKTHMQELSQSLANILPTASAAGVSLTDTSAAMATMTGEGIPAAQAATYLRQTIMSIENPSKKAADTMAALGLKSSDVAAEMKKSLPDALAMITDAAGKKFPVGSSEYVAAVANMVGGTKSMQGILDLTGSHMATFKGNVENIAGSVKKGGDSISGWSKVQGDFNQKMDQAKSSLETVGIKIGEKLLPVLGRLMDGISSPAFQKFATTVGTDLVNAITNLVNGISTLVGWGTQLVSFFQNNQIAMDALIAVMSAVGIIILAILVPAFIAWAAAMIPVVIEAALLAAPFVLAGAIIAAVIFVVILAIQHWGEIAHWLQGVWNGIPGFFRGIWNGIVAIFGAVGNWFHDRWTEAYNGTINAFKGIGKWFQGVWDGLIKDAGDAGSNIVKAIANGISGAVKFVQDAIHGVTQWISDHLPHSPAKVGPLVHLQEQGAEISNQIAKGMINGVPLINSAIGNMTKPITVGLKGTTATTSNNPPLQGGSQGDTHIHVYIDGKEVTNTVMKRAVKELRGHGLKK